MLLFFFRFFFVCTRVCLFWRASCSSTKGCFLFVCFVFRADVAQLTKVMKYQCKSITPIGNYV